MAQKAAQSKTGRVMRAPGRLWGHPPTDFCPSAKHRAKKLNPKMRGKNAILSIFDKNLLKLPKNFGSKCQRGNFGGVPGTPQLKGGSIQRWRGVWTPPLQKGGHPPPPPRTLSFQTLHTQMQAEINACGGSWRALEKPQTLRKCERKCTAYITRTTVSYLSIFFPTFQTDGQNVVSLEKS